jgi:hypothetical protein
MSLGSLLIHCFRVVNYSDESAEVIILRSPKEARPLPVRHTAGF